MAVRMFLALLSLSACCAISSAKAADVESFCSGPEDTCHSLLVKHHKVASLKTDLAEEDAQCTHSGEDSSFPQLGGCCSGLAVCNEPRSADDPAYCDTQDSEHDVSCWSTVQMCRSECEQVTCATTEDCVFLGDDQECTDAICQSATAAPAAEAFWAQISAAHGKLFENCSKVFLDIGANRGTHVRKLFEPIKYPRAMYQDVFNEAFGPGDHRSLPSSLTGICAFGFEANPRWTLRLNEIEQSYNAKGWRVKFFSPVAVSDYNGSAKLNLNDESGSKSDWAASMLKTSNAAKQVTVPVADITHFLQGLNNIARPKPSFTLMKMDIEGSEYAVIPEFLRKGLLCQGKVDALTIEWHHRYTGIDKDAAAAIEREVFDTRRCLPGRTTAVATLDDESYLDDGQPLP